MKKVNYALIGFGGIAENRIAKEGFAYDRQRFSPLDDVELVGATDINPGRRDAVEQLDIQWYNSFDEILADATVDAVFITTNNLTHASLCRTALEAGKHVIVEKPMATTSRAAKELTALAKAKGLSLTVDHMMTENVYNRKAKSLIEAGELGAVNDACFHMEFCYGATPEEAKTWRCSSVEELGGPIGDVASHCFYLAEFVFSSRIKQLACVYYPKIMATDVEDGAYIKIFLESGMTASVKVAFCEPRGGLGGTLTNLGYEIYGDQGALRSFGSMFQLSGYADEPIKIRLELDKFASVEDVSVSAPVNIYQEVIRKHAHSIQSNELLNGFDAVHNLKLIEAAHLSASRQGELVSVL